LFSGRSFSFFLFFPHPTALIVNPPRTFRVPFWMNFQKGPSQDSCPEAAYFLTSFLERTTFRETGSLLRRGTFPVLFLPFSPTCGLRLPQGTLPPPPQLKKNRPFFPRIFFHFSFPPPLNCNGPGRFLSRFSFCFPFPHTV